MTRSYAGIGSRSTPNDIRLIMSRCAFALAGKSYTLRSGGANGADSAFETGAASAGGKLEIYLPSYTFNQRVTDNRCYFDATDSPYWSEAIKIAKHYHPNPNALSSFALKSMARNTFQVLGSDLQSPSLFVLCWTPGGALTGGTSQAIRIANAHCIPVKNLAIKNDLDAVREWLQA